ncbi:MAG TPA: GGDEF domain-containing protein [Symbiobacteriaceae bacterium]|nr:GGDEF domain-containing protein [Symbiobacteriaceae bacterium]
MRARLSGALVGMAIVAAAYGFTYLPYGWFLAGAVIGFLGWGLGGYFRYLNRLTERDELTGIANRRAFERALEREWDRAVRNERSLSLLFLDVDDFGKVNKRFGHLMGDEVLKAITRLLRQSTRRYDVVARWGGEEFVVLLPETDRRTSMIIAERIRAVIEQTVVRDRDKAVSVTVSTGVACYPGACRSAQDLLRQAIGAQSAAKAHKNAVEIVS